jgi:hypothetical protein
MKRNRKKQNKKIIQCNKINTFIVCLILAAFASIGLPMMTSFNMVSIAKAAAATNSSSPTIDGIQCGAMEQFGFHIHVHLDIFINGNHHIIPALIGITGNCFYWLHTHDESGVIHIESIVKRDFTLGQFFDIWNKKFNNTQIFNNLVSSNNTLKVYVNGSKIVDGTNYRDIVLHDHDEIAIIYGNPPV